MKPRRVDRVITAAPWHLHRRPFQSSTPLCGTGAKFDALVARPRGPLRALMRDHVDHLRHAH